MGSIFKLHSPFAPAGDQPQAIKELLCGLNNGLKDQVLLGVTGSGKTYTMAKIIEESSRPALIMAPNKTLAAQLYTEMKEFFPENHVEYKIMLNILSPTMTTINPKPMSPKPTLISKKIRPSTSKLTACATLPPAHYLKAAML